MTNTNYAEIVMGKPKRPNESVFLTDLKLEEIGDIVFLGKPDVAKNPLTGKLEKIEEVIVTDKITYCPKCKQPNPIGIEITFLETVFIYNCKRCNKFVWCAKKGS